MPGKEWKRSLQSPERYEAIKAKLVKAGVPIEKAKESAARISNTVSPGHRVRKGK